MRTLDCLIVAICVITSACQHRPIDRSEASGVPSTASERAKDDCEVMPTRTMEVQMRVGSLSTWWLGDSRVTATGPKSDLVMRMLLDDPSFVATAGTARAVLARVQKTDVALIDSPRGGKASSWWPLASQVEGHSVHVIWRDSVNGPLVYGLYADDRWKQVATIPGSDSVDFQLSETGAMALDRGNVVVVARPTRIPSATPGASDDKEWRVYRWQDGLWITSTVPAWRHQPFFVSLTRERGGLALIALVPSLPGFAWSSRLLGQETGQFAAAEFEYSLGEPREQSGLASVGLEMGSLVASATSGSNDSVGNPGKLIVVNTFIAGELRWADSLHVSLDLASYTFAWLASDQPVLTTTFSDGTALVFVGRPQHSEGDDKRISWLRRALPGTSHAAMPILKRFDDQIWLYASEISGGSDAHAESMTVLSRAYQLRCDGL